MTTVSSDLPDSRSADDNPIVCHCMQVDLRTIQDVIRNGATTVSALQDATRACLGCGTCRFELTEWIARATPRITHPEIP